MSSPITFFCQPVLMPVFCCWQRRRRRRRCRKCSYRLFRAVCFSLYEPPSTDRGWRVSSSPLFYPGASKPPGNHRLRNSTKHTWTHRVKHARISRSGCHRHRETDEKMRCLSGGQTPPPMVDITVVSQFAVQTVWDMIVFFGCCMLRHDVDTKCSIQHGIIYRKQNEAQSEHASLCQLLSICRIHCFYR